MLAAMSHLPIGLQLYTVRDSMEKDVGDTLAAVADIGYTHVELAGLNGLTPDSFKALLDQHKLTAIAAHDGWALDGNLATAVSTAKIIGYDHVMQPWWPEDKRTVAGYGDVVSRGVAAAAEHGLTFGYHNHDFEFETLDNGKTAFETLFVDTDLVCEMDTAWVAIAGHDPVEWMDKLSGRVPLLHIKDASDFDKPTLCEVGTGKVNVKAILDNAERVGAKCLVVEQDNNWVDGDCLKSARVSFENLKGML